MTIKIAIASIALSAALATAAAAGRDPDEKFTIVGQPTAELIQNCDKILTISNSNTVTAGRDAAGQIMQAIGFCLGFIRGVSDAQSSLSPALDPTWPTSCPHDYQVTSTEMARQVLRQYTPAYDQLTAAAFVLRVLNVAYPCKKTAN